MNDPKNPYAPPTTRVADQEDRPQPTDSGTFIPDGRVRPAGAGARWIGDAWRMLKARPGPWALALILLFVAWIVLMVAGQIVLHLVRQSGRGDRSHGRCLLRRLSR